MNVVDYVKSRVEEGDPDFDLDWETAREIANSEAWALKEAEAAAPYEGNVPFHAKRGEARLMAKQTFDPDAKVSIVDGMNAPVFKALTTKEIKDYLRDKYQGLEVTIRSDGLKVEFTRKGIESSLKKRGIHREAYHVLDRLVRESRFTRYEDTDGKEKHRGVNGQFVYSSALRLADGIYPVELKLDDPVGESGRAKFKGQTLKTKIADAELYIGPHPEGSLPISQASATLRLGDFAQPNGNIVSHSSADAQGGLKFSVGRVNAAEKREYDEVVSRFTNADGSKKQGWMKAPNGKPTRLTERQWVQVRTPAFKAWFGDWENDPANASKVVDENGEPKPIDGCFVNFNQATFYSKRIERAKYWIDKITEWERKYNEEYPSRPFWEKVIYNNEEGVDEYVSARGDLDILVAALKNGITPELRIAYRYGEIPEDMRSHNYRDDFNEMGVSVVGRVADMNTARNNYYQAFFGHQPYNVVIGLDVGHTGSDGETLLSPALVLTKADGIGNVIKSATDNTGAFDAANPDIRFSARRQEGGGANAEQGVAFRELRDQRPAQSVEQARAALKDAGIVGKSLTNERLGITVVISNRDVAKMTSEKATRKSISPRLHSIAVANADKVFRAAFVDGTHDDTHGRKEVRRTHRLGSAVHDPESERFEPVMITVLEYVRDGVKMYTVEAIDVAKYENSAGQLAAVTVGERQAPIAEFVKSIANRVAEFNRGAKPEALKLSVGRVNASELPGSDIFAFKPKVESLPGGTRVADAPENMGERSNYGLTASRELPGFSKRGRGGARRVRARGAARGIHDVLFQNGQRTAQRRF